MAGMTLAQAEEKLSSYLSALDAILSGQEYKIGSRSLRRADLAAVQQGIDFWDAKVKKMTRGGIKVTGGTPV